MAVVVLGWPGGLKRKAEEENDDENDAPYIMLQHYLTTKRSVLAHFLSLLRMKSSQKPFTTTTSQSWQYVKYIKRVRKILTGVSSPFSRESARMISITKRM